MKTIIQAIDFTARKILTDGKVTLRLNKSDQKESKVCEIRLAISAVLT